MKAIRMATEPVSGFAAGLLIKTLIAAGIGICGAAVMAAFDPPTSRKELFAQAAVAGASSIIFGKVAALAANHYLSFLPLDDLSIPAYFLVGAMSWGLCGAVAKFRKLVADKAAAALANKLGGGE